PLARGRLTRPWGETTARLVSDQFGKSLYEETEGIDAIIAELVASLADERGVSRAQIALAWLLNKPAVSAPIVGASRSEQLDDAIAAVDLSLSPQEVAELETAYVPHRVTGFE
ncbi:aldo/keto reductase, partial [Serratia marcescens]|uniref:aldo/keto reductase n=5 Tax=Serratia TaxID=613 RepID=UPI001BD5CC9F